MYKESDVVRIGKRENNKKRKYLVVNRLQGKHLPVSPQKSLAMFDALTEVIKDVYQGENLLLVGFAETATAIGSRLAVNLKAEYIQTTREIIDGVSYLYFTEAHSHAAEQKLVKDDVDKALEGIQRIVFVEDEITTGNTILNIVNVLQKQYQKEIQFSVASLLNGMDEAALNIFRERNIGVHYLVKTDHSSYTKLAEKYQSDGVYEGKMVSDIEPFNKNNAKVITLTGYVDARRLVSGQAYHYACLNLWEQVKHYISLNKGDTILVLGTEEFMYPALFVAHQIENSGKTVRFHATTRSPIVVSKAEDYPLHHRFELESAYESGRTTYIYDLEKYDQVIILTDAKDRDSSGIQTLVKAVSSVGNDSITTFRWGE